LRPLKKGQIVLIGGSPFMSNTFVFIGEPGPDAKEKLKIIVKLNAAVKRLPADASVDDVEKLAPHSIILGQNVKKMDQLVIGLRERKSVRDVPVIASVESINSRKKVEDAFKSGVDDIIVDGKINQFYAMASLITKHDTWDVMRAPAGAIGLGHADRIARMKLGQMLRRNGFDLHFAADRDELDLMVKNKKPRAVITTLQMGRSFLNGGGGKSVLKVPCIILASADEIASLNISVAPDSQIRFLDEQSDFESLTFLLNDLLAPAQKSERRTPRILYGTTVAFRPENTGDDAVFYGFTYNVNIGGLFIRTITAPPMQSRLLVEFTPPFGKGRVAMVAQVVWLKPIGHASGAATPAGIGVQFVQSWLADKAGFEAGYNAIRKESEKGRNVYSSIVPSSIVTEYDL
jgi:Tfp pilus assembly protein PilZ